MDLRKYRITEAAMEFAKQYQEENRPIVARLFIAGAEWADKNPMNNDPHHPQ
ncbi:MAG: hypothetical protein IJS00_05555 [Paludibacteraceae bacterium]|nr:hypothetical protein [Paludibacteraceae bacterium]